MHTTRVFLASAAWRVRAAAVGALFACVLAPLSALAQTWVPDPAYNGGLIGPDAFAGSSTRNYFGRKLVLKDGEIIAAGIVPALSGDLGALGLVRYNQAGTRQVWSNPGVYGHNANQYVVLPNGTFNRVTEVRDLVLFGERLFVLVETERYTLGNPINNPGTHFHGYGVEVLVFGTDGSFKSAAEADFDNQDVDVRSAWGGGIALYDNGQFPTTVSLIYAGRKTIGGVERPALRRFTVDNAGVLTAAYAVQHPTFGGTCTTTAHCSVFGIALGGRATFTSPPRIYLVGSHFSTCSGICYSGWQTIVMRVDTNAQPVTAFGNNGVAAVQYGSGSRGRAIAVQPGLAVLNLSDRIRTASEVDLSCAQGIAVTQFNDAGVTVPSTTLYAGSSATGPACALQHELGSARDSYPTGIAISGDDIAVSSYAVGGPGVLCPVGQPCPEDRFDGEVAVIDGSTGGLSSHQRYPYISTPGGARERHSELHDIVGGEGSFSLVGGVRYTQTHDNVNARGKTQFATLRIVPSAVLFEDGFE